MWTFRMNHDESAEENALVCCGDKIYSFWGKYGGSHGNVMDTSTLQWKSLKYLRSRLPKSRVSHTAVIYKNTIIIWGGRSKWWDPNIHCLNLETLAWSTPSCTGVIPEPKEYHTATVVEDDLYIFGGRNEILEILPELYKIDLKTFHWEKIDPAGGNPSLAEHSAVVYEQNIYVFGGNDSNRTTISDLYRFDLRSKEWWVQNPTGDCPVGRKSHCAWAYRKYMYIFGGTDSNRLRYFNSLHRYSFEGNYWQDVIVGGEAPSPRSFYTCGPIGDKVYIFGNKSFIEQFYEAEIGFVHPNLHILDLEPTLQTLAMVCVLRNNIDFSSLPPKIANNLKICGGYSQRASNLTKTRTSRTKSVLNTNRYRTTYRLSDIFF